jgi:hypothetical protein
MSPILAGLGGLSVRGFGHFGPVRDVDTGAMFPLQVVTVGAAGASEINFTNIPTTGYEHLQIRAFAQSNRGTYGNDDCWIRVGNGSVDTGSNYAYHILSGDGSTASAGAGSSQSRGYFGYAGTGVSSTFGAGIVDVLDYANTNKTKTIRVLNGQDQNGLVASYGGAVIFTSSLWNSTSAITHIRIYPNVGTQFNQYSQFALYGVKGAA